MPDTLNFMHSPTFHIRHIHSTDIDYYNNNNNLMERFNGWIRARTRAARGLRRIDSAMLRGLRIMHNFIRPHGAWAESPPRRRPGSASRAPTRR